MSQIYKIAHLKNNSIEKMYIFIGKTEYNKDELNKLFETDPKNKVFSKIGYNSFKDILNDNTKIEFILDIIHHDDSVETIKKKILKTTNINFSFYEMYLFIKQIKILNVTNVYYNLTQQNKLNLTKIRLYELLHNINKPDLIDKLENKEVYNYNDLVNLNIDKATFLINKAIGQKFIVTDTKFPFFVNPYDATSYDKLLTEYADNIVTTTNHSLLMNFGEIDNNIIYMNLADDVLTSAIEQNLSQKTCIKIYYPYLHEKRIYSQNELNKKNQELQILSEDMITEKFDIIQSNINYLHSVYNTNKSQLIYSEKGIKSINLIIHPESIFKLPLDIVFKLINTTKQVPLIKYNPGKKQEKMYRLYSNKLATNGKKIPYLNKLVIFKLMKQIGKNKCVSIYIDYYIDNDTIPIVCEFINNGTINIKIDFIKPYKNVDKIIKNATNKIIDIVKDYITQSGYNINSFISIEDSNVEIINIDYFMKLEIQKKIELDKIIHCLSGVFSITNSDILAGGLMRYKRVENYNEMDNQEQLIIELLKEENSGTKIIESLQTNFNMKKPEAIKKFETFISSLQVMQNAFENRKFKIKNNPGFKITIEKDAYNNISLNVTGIDNINYIKSIEMYLHTLLVISQNKELAENCLSLKDEEEITVEDIVNEDENVKPNIVGNKLEFNKINDLETEDNDMFLYEEDSSDEDEDDEDEDDEDGEEREMLDDFEGGANYEINLDNISLRNYFSERMKTRDKNLFVTEREGNINAYSRSCPSQHRRQPVILTNEEKDRIDTEHPGSYNKAIKYGSSKDNDHWYICPRYWSLKNNTSLTEAQAKSGKYGSIIPQDAKKIPKGAGVYEFRSEKYHENQDGSYKQHYPGFQKPNKLNNGLCAPCCFTDFDGNLQVKRRKLCLDNSKEKPLETKKVSKIKEEDYIKGPDKFPLETGRYGHLPPVVENFLNTENKLCYISNSNTNLKLNHSCVLRKGVENNKNQSFIACIADIFPSPELTIVDMKEKLIQSLTYDLFVELQNGNLISIFDDSNNNEITKEFKTSKLYKKLKSKNPEINIYFKKVISAYNNFILFLRDNEVLIDHTYLWDLICKPNAIFVNGYNMIILEIVDDDITDKIDILCPSNSYSSSLFDEKKNTFILLKNKNYYEPICVRTDSENKRDIMKTFNINSKEILKNLKETFTMIKNSQKKCEGLASMPNIYKFKKNITLNKLINILQLKSFDITKYIFNYNGKVIAIEAKKNTNQGIIPCFPSAPIINLENIEYVWINEILGYSYVNTIDFLNYVSKQSNDIYSEPQLKVLEDEMIVGIITETNQFVPINPPEPNTFDDELKEITSSNYTSIDETIMKEYKDTDGIDIERINYIKRIKLESGFYKIFRNNIRTMLGEYKNNNIRNNIEEIVNSSNILYKNKLEQIKSLLKAMAKDYIEFTDKIDENALNDINEIKNCYKSDDCDDLFFCFKNSSNECSMYIPKQNLINSDTDVDNEEKYFGKITDELVRFNRIREFIFEPKSFLSLTKMDYNLHDDEIILLESLLSNDYFEDIVEYKSNSYVKNNTFDTSQPMKTQTYSNEVTPYAGNVNTKECEPQQREKIKGIWFKLFPEDSIYNTHPINSANCSFNIILALISSHDKNNSSINIENIKTLLIDKYFELSNKFSKNLAVILSKQGKKKYVDLLKNKNYSHENMILDKEYYITNLDINIIANHFKIPLVLFSKNKLAESKKTMSKNENIFVSYSDNSKKYYFINVEQKYNKYIYKLVVLPDNNSLISLDKLRLNDYKRDIRNNIKLNNFNSYISENTNSVVKTNKKIKLK